MTRLEDFSDPAGHSDGEGKALPLKDRLRLLLGQARAAFTPLWRDVQRFSRWAEGAAISEAIKAERESVRLEILPASSQLRGGSFALRLPGVAEDHPEFGRLAEFLSSLQIRYVDLDCRLNCEQIRQVLLMLFSYRAGLRRGTSAKTAGTVVPQLFADDGLHQFCCRTRISGEVLSIEYSRCSVHIRHIVRWFEGRSRHFSDHRALFHSAPRYAALAAVITLVPFVIYTLSADNWNILLIVSVLGACALFAMVYLFFMIVGSTEYENEIKTHRLIRAYDELNLYSTRVRDDLCRARLLQQRMLPDFQSLPTASQLLWASSFIPAEEVGGDYYDVADLGDNRVAILFGDVSGHGMVAAFVTAILKTIFQAWAEDGADLENLAGRLNHHLYRLVPEDCFAAVFLAIYDGSERRLTYLNAGHNPEPWLLRAGGSARPIPLCDARSVLLGVQEEIVIRQSSLVLQEGDKVLFATDGVIESRDAGGEMLGTEKLEELLATHRDLPAPELVERLAQELAAFGNGARQMDDQTILAFQVQ